MQCTTTTPSCWSMASASAKTCGKKRQREAALFTLAQRYSQCGCRSQPDGMEA